MKAMVAKKASCRVLDANQSEPVDIGNKRVYDRALAATSCGIVISDARCFDNPIIYCNPAFLKITGYSQEEVIGRNCRFLQGHDTDPIAVEQIRQSIRTGQEVRVVLKNYRKDGTLFWNDLTISPVRDSSGKVTHFIGVQTDITERKQAEETQQLMQFSIDRAADAVFYIRPDGTLFYVNETASKALKYSREELLRLSIQDIDPNFSLSVWQSHWQQVREGGSFSIETQHRAKDGQVFPVEVTFNYLRFNNQEYNCAFARDISEAYRQAQASKQAQKALQRSNALLKAQQESDPNGVLVTDETGATLSYNQRFCEMWQIPEGMRQLGEHKIIFNWLLPLIQEPQRVFSQMEYLEENPSLISREEIHLTNGRVFDCYSAPARSPEGESYGRIWSFQDITEQKQTETRLRQQAERERLVSGINQRIRQSLNLDEVLNTAVEEVRQFLACDRTLICRFNLDWSGTIVVESVGEEWTPASAINIQDTCFQESKAHLYQKGRIRAINDIYNTDLSPCHIQLLERFQVRANLVVPILQGDKLWGLLIAHQCSKTRDWQDSTIELLRQISVQLSVAIQQAALFKQLAEELAERKAAEAALRRSKQALKTQATELKKALNDLKQAQLQLIQTEKMSGLGQLVAGVAHEINNPVTFISGNITHAEMYAQDLLELVELYTENYPQPVPAIAKQIEVIDFDFLKKDFPKLLKSMEIGAYRIRQIVLSLKNFSRVDEAERKLVDIHEGIENTLLILQHRLKPEAGNIQLVKEYGNLPFVECYPGQLNQVFMNLLNNAIDALEKSVPVVTTEHHTTQATTPSQPKTKIIKISTEVADCSPSQTSNSDEIGTPQNVIIRIADNGSGIPKDVKKRIFDPFFTTKPVGEGTGLGLSISYQIIVEKHGGQLECLSVPGEGTEFIVQIPLAPSKIKTLQTTTLPSGEG
ncbi:PAS domain S-box [Allocoleopsis franciscana PCC 7113]|uniref:histidine kinase n=2 Tax=Allocoleopsis TaxID=2886347 RepID=K9WEP7_9CYAN|nr:PAS domain S-box [Allocoleopsis franciscana PCC 7113]